MRRQVLIILVLLAALAGGAAFGRAEPEAPEVLDMESVEVVEDISQMGPSSILGLTRYQWLTLSGPLIWILMAAGIGTRHLKIKGKAGQLMTVHRFCGYAALVVGTLHGILALFF